MTVHGEKLHSMPMLQYHIPLPLYLMETSINAVAVGAARDAHPRSISWVESVLPSEKTSDETGETQIDLGLNLDPASYK